MPELKFDNKIYKKEAIKKAIFAYAEFAKFSLSEDKKYIKVKMEKILPHVKNTVIDEFSNFVLGVTKKCL